MVASDVSIGRQGEARAPRWLNPSHLMHTVPAEEPFSAPGWIFEVKYDGLRLLAQKHATALRMQSRRGLDLSSFFPEITEALAAIPDDFALDAELVLLNASGEPDFERLRHRALFRRPEQVRTAAKTQPATVLAFDLLQHDGEDIRFLPLVDRKKILEGMLVDSTRVCCLAHIEESGIELYREVEQRGLEGIVAKRLDSPYISGRSGYWLKIKTGIGRRREIERMRNLRE